MKLFKEDSSSSLTKKRLSQIKSFQYIRDSAGAAILEFAIILPVYLLFIFGIIELGYVLWGNSALEHGASYGARYAFVHPTSSSSTIKSAALASIDFPNNDITYNVTISPNVSADIDGSFSYTFKVLPLNPLTITTHIHQVLPTPS